MEKIREILAQNMKTYRQKLGITQPEFAERAISEAVSKAIKEQYKINKLK